MSSERVISFPSIHQVDERYSIAVRLAVAALLFLPVENVSVNCFAGRYMATTFTFFPQKGERVIQQTLTVLTDGLLLLLLLLFL